MWIISFSTSLRTKEFTQVLEQSLRQIFAKVWVSETPFQHRLKGPCRDHLCLRLPVGLFCASVNSQRPSWNISYSSINLLGTSTTAARVQKWPETTVSTKRKLLFSMKTLCFTRIRRLQLQAGLLERHLPAKLSYQKKKRVTASMSNR